MSKFYPLELNQFLMMNTNLKDAELRVCLYLMVRDPFGEHKLEIETAVIAEQLGLTRRTIQRSLNRLDELGLIEWKVTKQHIVGKWRHVDQQATDGSPEQKLTATLGSPKRHTDRQSDIRIAKATLGSPKQAEIQTEQSVQNPKTIKTIKTDQIRSRDENFELKDHDIETKVDPAAEGILKVIAKEIEPDDPDQNFKDFIIKSIEKERKITIANREAYLSKVLAKDREHWRSLYQESLKPKPKPRDTISENIYLLESSLGNAIRMRDYEYAIAKLENVPEMQQQIFDRHPEWRTLLCG